MIFFFNIKRFFWGWCKEIKVLFDVDEGFYDVYIRRGIYLIRWGRRGINWIGIGRGDREFWVVLNVLSVNEF